MFVEKTPEGKALQRALLQYYEPRNAEKVVKALRMTHREDLIPCWCPPRGRRAVQRSARRADSPEVTIHNDGTYTVRPNQKGKGKPAHGPNRTAALPGVSPARCPLCAALGPRTQTQKESTERAYIVENWNKEKVTPKRKLACCSGCCRWPLRPHWP